MRIEILVYLKQWFDGVRIQLFLRLVSELVEAEGLKLRAVRYLGPIISPAKHVARLSMHTKQPSCVHTSRRLLA